MTKSESSEIKSLHRLSGIIELLKQRGPLSVTAVAEACGTSRSTAHAYLSTMCETEYAVATPDGYDLSLKFLDPGIHALDSLPIVSVGRPVVEQLADDTGEAAWLIVEEHGWAVCAHYGFGERAVHTEGRVGQRSPLHSHAAGKAILAQLPDERVEEIISKHGLDAQTEHTIDSTETLFTELDRVCDRGYALNEHESVSGARAVGAAVIAGDTVRGALSVSGPANRVTKERAESEIADSLLAATNELELRLDAEHQ